MSDHVIAYNPNDEVIDRLLEDGKLLAEWGENTDKELLFKLQNSLFNEKELEYFLCRQTYDNLDTVISRINSKSEILEWVESDKTFEDRLYITDFLSENKYAEVCNIINTESLGGDIRKYLSSLYGGQKFSINFSLFRSRDISITSMEPMSVSSVKGLLNEGIAKKGLYKGKKLYYPPPERIIKWSEMVNDEWGLDCGAIGAIHNPYRSDEIDVGFTGFVIYDADEEVKNRCDKRWDSDNDIEYPFMRPYEYDLRLESNDWTPRSAIRMWWD
jgi:hypothetical protein